MNKKQKRAYDKGYRDGLMRSLEIFEEVQKDLLRNKNISNYKSNRPYVSYDLEYRNNLNPTIYSDIDNMFFEDPYEAKKVLERMRDKLRAFGKVTIADLMNYIEVKNGYQNYHDNRYGWTNLDGVIVKEAVPGKLYKITLQKPSLLIE